ncbi:MAG: UDP-N-acetylglucosamine 2-epimerase (non-hydrolyzing) [Acidobacteriia bacterium]|nr:UDP-N-acetylglucosamine 2-epimerase (non-hydrolyzing) [Terriglobia bacterium]
MSIPKSPHKILTLFGTRPEVIKLAPVIRELEGRPQIFRTINVASGQHAELFHPFVRLFDIRIDHNLEIMRENQTPNQVCARVLSEFEPILAQQEPDLLLVQGDTTTAMAGALTAFHRRIPVGHVEAGLRSGNVLSPYPEEMNRRLITRLATYHFAATEHNRETLLQEGIAADSIFVTGNPVVDSLNAILARKPRLPRIEEILSSTSGMKRIVLTTHRRESFGEIMEGNLRVLRRFVERHDGVALIFPVHLNPAVVEKAKSILSEHPRIHLTSPLGYEEFVFLLSQAWLIVSDSGGVQEEAPTLGKPLLILRENTERPEAIQSGVARLVGGDPLRLEEMLEEAIGDESWITKVGKTENPFGCGDSGKRICQILESLVTGPAWKGHGRTQTNAD